MLRRMASLTSGEEAATAEATSPATILVLDQTTCSFSPWIIAESSAFNLTYPEGGRLDLTLMECSGYYVGLLLKYMILYRLNKENVISL